MATTLGDAKVRVTIDRSQARREAEAQEAEEKKREERRERDIDRKDRERERRRQEADRPAQPGAETAPGGGGGGAAGARARQAVQNSMREIRAGRPLSAVASVVSSIPGIEVLGVGLGVAMLAEELGPLGGGVIAGLLPEGPARDQVRNAYEGLDAVAIERIRELRSLISSGFQLQEQLRQLSAARILAANSPDEANFEGLGTLGRALFDANQAIARIERDRKALTRRAVGEVMGSELRELFSGAMGGQ